MRKRHTHHIFPLLSHKTVRKKAEKTSEILQRMCYVQEINFTNQHLWQKSFALKGKAG